MIKLLSVILAAALPLDVGYARIGSGAVLCDFDGKAYSEIAVLPQSYFVAVLSENDDGYSLVSYCSVSGYVKSDVLTNVAFTPKEKYSRAAFKVDNDSQPANLRSSPSKDSEVLAVMPNGGGGTVIGTAKGDELISGAGDDWYYVRYENGGIFTYGYAYAPHISAEDFGVCSPEAEDPPEPATQNGQDSPKAELSVPVRIVIIVALCVPLGVAAFMLRPKKRASDGGAAS